MWQKLWSIFVIVLLLAGAAILVVALGGLGGCVAAGRDQGLNPKLFEQLLALFQITNQVGGNQTGAKVGGEGDSVGLWLAIAGLTAMALAIVALAGYRVQRWWRLRREVQHAPPPDRQL